MLQIKTDNRVYGWLLRHSQPTWNITKYILTKYFTTKKLIIAVRLEHFSTELVYLSLDSFLFFSAAFFALLNLFSSSESDARSSDSYSWTTDQPSLVLSAIVMSFCRFLMTCCPSSTNFRTLIELSTLSLISESTLAICALTSNCFLFPLDLNWFASFSIFDVLANCLPFGF